MRYPPAFLYSTACDNQTVNGVYQSKGRKVKPKGSVEWGAGVVEFCMFASCCRERTSLQESAAVSSLELDSTLKSVSSNKIILTCMCFSISIWALPDSLHVKNDDYDDDDAYYVASSPAIAYRRGGQDHCCCYCQNKAGL